MVGTADFPGDVIHHAFIWQDGVKTDLGTVDGDMCTNGVGINSGGQAIGTSADCHGNVLHLFLWEHGSMLNLTGLILPGSNVIFDDPTFINDRGEIVGNGLLPNGDQHAVLLIPCDESHRGVEGCDYSMVDGSDRQATQMATTAKPVLSPDSIRQLMQSAGRRSKPWYRGFEPQTQPK